MVCLGFLELLYAFRYNPANRWIHSFRLVASFFTRITRSTSTEFVIEVKKATAYDFKVKKLADEIEREKEELARKWKAIKEYVLKNRPELWDTDLDTAFQTIVLD